MEASYLKFNIVNTLTIWGMVFLGLAAWAGVQKLRGRA